MTMAPTTSTIGRTDIPVEHTPRERTAAGEGDGASGARLFVSATRPGQDTMATTELLVTVVSGTVGAGSVIETCDGSRHPVLSVAHTCRSCSFGDELQEGDRGALTVMGVLALSPGTMVSSS